MLMIPETRRTEASLGNLSAMRIVAASILKSAAKFGAEGGFERLDTLNDVAWRTFTHEDEGSWVHHEIS